MHRTQREKMGWRDEVREREPEAKERMCTSDDAERKEATKWSKKRAKVRFRMGLPKDQERRESDKGRGVCVEGRGGTLKLRFKFKVAEKIGMEGRGRSKSGRSRDKKRTGHV